MDLDGLGSKHLTNTGRNYLTAAIHMSQAHYPEMLNKLIIINTPWVFNMVWVGRVSVSAFSVIIYDSMVGYPVALNQNLPLITRSIQICTFLRVVSSPIYFLAATPFADLGDCEAVAA